MNRVAFEIFGISVYWYGIIMAVGAYLGIIIASKKVGAVKNLDEDSLFMFAFVVLIAGVIGARLYYVVFYDLDYFLANPAQIFNTRGGGLAIHGGVIAGVIAGFIFSKIKKLNVLELADITMPSLILAQAIGRWGNYVNQEAHGGPTDLPWGIMVDGVKVHPTFLYESLWNFAIFCFLHFYMWKRPRKSGEIFCWYFILYGIGRFFIEGLRTDSLMLGSIRVAQLVSLITIVIGLITLFVIKTKKEKI